MVFKSKKIKKSKPNSKSIQKSKTLPKTLAKIHRKLKQKSKKYIGSASQHEFYDINYTLSLFLLILDGYDDNTQFFKNHKRNWLLSTYHIYHTNENINDYSFRDFFKNFIILKDSYRYTYFLELINIIQHNYQMAINLHPYNQLLKNSFSLFTMVTQCRTCEILISELNASLQNNNYEFRLPLNLYEYLEEQIKKDNLDIDLENSTNLQKIQLLSDKEYIHKVQENIALDIGLRDPALKRGYLFKFFEPIFNSEINLLNLFVNALEFDTRTKKIIQDKVLMLRNYILSNYISEIQLRFMKYYDISNTERKRKAQNKFLSTNFNTK
tara:strand:+ start:2739 stop:3713 length:975 start_codon:yes stop_codon:yes gene_type:complete